MSAAQNSLLSQLYPEILNAQTGYMNGTDVNTEELMQLAPDVVFYSASNPALGESSRLPVLRGAGVREQVAVQLLKDAQQLD